MWSEPVTFGGGMTMAYGLPGGAPPCREAPAAKARAFSQAP